MRLIINSLFRVMTYLLTYLPTYLLTYLLIINSLFRVMPAIVNVVGVIPYIHTYILTYLHTYLLTYLLTYLGDAGNRQRRRRDPRPPSRLCHIRHAALLRAASLLTYLPTYLLTYLLAILGMQLFCGQLAACTEATIPTRAECVGVGEDSYPRRWENLLT